RAGRTRAAQSKRSCSLREVISIVVSRPWQHLSWSVYATPPTGFPKIGNTRAESFPSEGKRRTVLPMRETTSRTGAAIRWLRNLADMSLEDVAAAANVGTSHLSRVERGE